MRKERLGDVICTVIQVVLHYDLERAFFILDFMQSRIRRRNGIKNLPRLEAEVCMLFDSVEKIH